jgi:hypothetical protein
MGMKAPPLGIRHFKTLVFRLNAPMVDSRLTPVSRKLIQAKPQKIKQTKLTQYKPNEG